MLWLHSAAFILGLWGVFLLGRAAARRRRLALVFASAGLLWFLSCLFLLRRQDLLVNRLLPVVPLGDQLLFLDLWMAWPATFVFAALLPWLARARDRLAVGILQAAIAVLSAGAAFFTTVWPYRELSDRPAEDGHYRQSSGYSCGAAAAATFLKLGAGISASEREMARAAGVRPLRGVTMAGAWWGVEKRLRPAGLRAALRRPAFEELDRLPLPAMLTIRHGFLMDHMVVLLSIKEGKALMVDPTEGLVEWDLQQLRRKWRGEVIVLDRR